MDAELEQFREIVWLLAGFYARPRDVAQRRSSRWAWRPAPGEGAEALVRGAGAKLALALIGDPEVLFLGREPTTGFDPNARREAWGMIAGLRRSGTTVLLTSRSRRGTAAGGPGEHDQPRPPDRGRTPDALGGRAMSPAPWSASGFPSDCGAVNRQPGLGIGPAGLRAARHASTSPPGSCWP